MPEALQRSSANALTETEAHISSLQDLSEQDTLFTFMPKSFRGLLPENPTDPLNGEQDRHRILSRPEALKKTARDAEQINAILADTSTLNILEINFDTDKFCETKSVQPEYIEGMAQKPEFCKENVNPNEHFPNSRIRREGTGRVSSRRPFTLNSSSLGSDINVQKDPSTRGDVFDFFLDDARQEAAAALIRKLRGENSPDALCTQQSLKKRVRRQGTGRRKISKNFDWKLLGDSEKYMFLDDEKLEVEEEDALYSFTTEAERSCEEQRNKECLSETVNAELQYHKDVQFNSNSKICKQVHDQHSMSNVGDIDGRQPNPAQEKETLCASETEETVNMPLNTFVSFGNSTRNAFCELLKDCMKQGVDNTNSKTISKARHEINEIEKSYAKSLDCDTKYALQQSQTESSNTFHSQALFTDEDKTSMQLHQLPKDFHLEVFDKSPCENICQKPMENPSPLTSPTPPSKITAAFLQHKKLKRGIGIKIRDACKPSLEKRDEEVVKVHSSSHSQSSRRPHTSLHSHISRGLHNSSPSHSSSPSQSSRRLHISSPQQRSRRLNTSSPSHISRMLSVESPLEKNQSSGVRRLSFDSSSKSTKQDDKQAEIDSRESPNDVKIRDIVNPSTYSESDKGEMETSDLENSNLTGMRPQQSTPVMVTEVQDLHAVVPEYMEKDILGSASGKRIEEAPVNLHKKNVRKGKTQSKNNSKASGRDAHGKDTVISNEIVPMKRKNKKSDYQRRQSLAGAGTLWKSGVRRSTRIRSRPLEFWRGERFLYGRIHNTLATVIGIKYTSPLSKHEKRRDAPNFKVKSYVDEQYSHLVEFAASH